MRKIKLKAGTFEFNDLFAPVVRKAIQDNKTGPLFNPHDNCYIFMDSIEAIEDVNGLMIEVRRV